MKCETAKHCRVPASTQPPGGNILKAQRKTRRPRPIGVQGVSIRIDPFKPALRTDGPDGQGHFSRPPGQVQPAGTIRIPGQQDLFNQFSNDRFMGIAVIRSVFSVILLGTMSEVGVVDGRRGAGWFHRFISTWTYE